ncbi:MAG: hypothetical protein L7V86_25110, partial [Verrucomicrobiales bacterium]|nr:hypothetical protein [Verrucomicrobiales bacterium]
PPQIRVFENRLQIQLPQGQSLPSGTILEVSPNLQPGSWKALSPVPPEDDRTWWIELGAEQAAWYRLRLPEPE